MFNSPLDVLVNENGFLHSTKTNISLAFHSLLSNNIGGTEYILPRLVQLNSSPLTLLVRNSFLLQK